VTEEPKKIGSKQNGSFKSGVQKGTLRRGGLAPGDHPTMPYLPGWTIAIPIMTFVGIVILLINGIIYAAIHHKRE
jgi:hypothetical protein